MLFRHLNNKHAPCKNAKKPFEKGIFKIGEIFVFSCGEMAAQTAVLLRDKRKRLMSD